MGLDFDAASTRPWVRHYQDVWERRSGDPLLPYWLRVAALAYGKQQDNGHAPFRRGQIALILGRPDHPYAHVGRAIEDAIEYGWLGPGSYWGCLIVPFDHAKKGKLSRPTPCRKQAAHDRNLT